MASAGKVPTPHVLREYAFIGDGERGAIVGGRGEIVWLCAPRWDSDAVFAALIGGPGSYLIAPADPWFVWGGHYERGTLIWRNRWVTRDGIVECRDALVFPGNPRRAVLLRRVVPLDYAGDVRILLDPAAGFGADRTRWDGRTNGHWTGRAGPLRLRWSGAADARPVEGSTGALAFTLSAEAGSHHDLVLEIADGPLDGPPVDPDHAWETTGRAWADAVPTCDDTAAPTDARQAYTVMRGLTGGTGGMVAAATTSLPERAEEHRNYDYRYVWIRDQCYAAGAVGAHGPHPMFEQMVRFVTDRVLADGSDLKPAYTPSGGPVPGVRSLPFPGYPGGEPAAGNAVNDQFQLDAIGEALSLFALAARLGRLDADGWRAVDVAVRAVEKRWREPDAGVWELGDRHWTHSRLACVAGLRAIADRVPARSNDADRWRRLAKTVMSSVSATCVHPSGRWRRAPDDDRVDAALVFPPVRGALPADDPRALATLHAVREELVQDGYVYRYRHGGRPLGSAEGAFLLCGFFMSLAMLQQGDEVGAFRWFERNRAACGPPALYSEEYDVSQRQLRGNLPQAFVHGLLLECATRLTRNTLT